MDRLGATRALFGTSLGFHIVFATLGVGLPLMIALAEGLGLRRGDPAYRLMARRWAAVFTVFLGTGVVSGTIIAVQLQLLWPGFMRLAGQIIALPFAIEVFAFFLEAVFTAIYLHASDRIAPRWRLASACLVALGAGASALLITDVNAFMNTPVGFRLVDGRLADVNPWRAMLSPAMPTELSHVLVTAYLAVALLLAAFAAAGLRRAPTDAERAYRRRELDLTMAVAGVAAVLTGITGDQAGKFLERFQPLKLAAAEVLFHTSRHAALTVGGLADAATATVRDGLRLPGLLSWLATGSTRGEVRGLLAFPRSQWPPVAAVHLLFDLMVGIGTLAFAAAVVYGAWRWRSRGGDPPAWIIWLLLLLGPLGMVGIESGWIFAELGRQPWTIVGVLTTAQAVTSAPDVGRLFVPFVGLYVLLALGAVFAVRGHLRAHPLRAELERLEPAAADVGRRGDE